ncbi:sensor histidine kinase [Bacillus suaedaesalsae]|uniref:histidine kinase n=1 Tax=Bacillus suaedaesalsae TaxID=2810349 RepID=A0ABS2DJK0_9BACI|nr:HAMP domain-containing sensor histidine kinase [Bacillus suaedaesalsae]MBM6618653.1 HAMP domain-containing histidine kinase [Bacillus suaedaesalsae]
MEQVSWLKDFENENKEVILDRWISLIEENFPGLYNHNDLRKNGRIYFQLLIDIHNPLDNHRFYHIIPDMCEYHSKINTPIEHILHSSHLWREAVSTCVWDYFEVKKLALSNVTSVLGSLHKRIDQAQRHISRIYINKAEEIIDEREREIQRLHNDRLNLLGKMGANMAHEIRNPLTAIDGFHKLIRSELPLDSMERVSKYMDIIDRELAGLYRQITGFLSFSKNNGIEEPYSEYESHDFLQSVVDLVYPKCIDENIELVLETDVSFTIVVQKIAIQQVLSNLINNAIEELNSVSYLKRIILRTNQDEENYYISVIDNGNGIEPDVQEKIFEPFVTGKANGTGLGLSICKQLLEKNEGDLTFTSKKGETIFTISLKKECSLKVAK